MPNKNLNDNNQINSFDNNNKLQNKDSVPEKQGFLEKLLNFFKSIGESIVNAIEYIKAQERKLISNKTKPGLWVIMPPPTRINDPALLYDDNTEKSKSLPNIPEVPENLEQSNKINSSTTLDIVVHEFQQSIKQQPEMAKQQTNTLNK